MPNQKVPQLPILTAITDADLFYVVDVSDTTDDPTGSSKQVTREEILTNVSYVEFNTTATTTHVEGRVHWNNTLKTLEVDTENSNVQIDVGHELVIRVNNQTGGVLSKGRAVYINGQQGNRPTVAYGSYTADTSSAGIVGLVADDINDNNNGYVIAYGLIENVNTSAYSAGTPLYLFTGGTITDVKPQAPNHDVRIGKVINSNSTVGSIFVTIQNGYELDELHDVRITSPTTNDMLVYGSYNGSPVWVNTKTLSGLTYVEATTISATTYQNLPVDPNYYVTAFTYSNNVLTIKQNGQSDLTALINTVTGWTVNGNLTVTGNTSLQGVTATTVSATTVSATTYYGSGTNLTGVVKGAGTANYLPRWTGTTGLGNSIIQDDGTNASIGATPSTNAKFFIYTSTNSYSLWVRNASSTTGSKGIYATSDSGFGSQTGIHGMGQGHQTTGTSIGVYGSGTDGLVAIGVKGDVGRSEFGNITTGIGGYFDGRGDGTYGYPTTSYGMQVIDGTEGVNKVLISVTTDGKTNWSSSLSGLTTVRATTISGGTVSGGTMVITSTPATDNTNTQVLSRDPSTGTIELVDMSAIQVSFNYGLANAIMTGNFLT